MASALNNVAHHALKNFAEMPDNKNKAIDPAFITLLMQIIMQLVASFQNCKKPPTPPEALAMAKNPTFLQKLVVRRSVINTLGRRGFREHGESVVSALLKTGKEVTETEVAELLDD